MSGPARREFGTALGLCALGAGLVFFALSRGWVVLDVARDRPLPPLSVTRSGRDVEPVITGLAVVGLTGVVGLLATRRTGRVVVGAVLVVVGVVSAVLAAPHLRAPSEAAARALLGSGGAGGSGGSGGPVGVGPDATVAVQAHPWWPALAVLGGLLLVAGGALAVVRARRWPAMSDRYEPPGGVTQPGGRAGEPSQHALWDAQDRGDDLTVR